MMLTKYLWSALAGALSIVALMAGAWAHEVEIRIDIEDQRLATAEQHYAAIQTDLQNMREQLKDLKSIILRYPPEQR